MKSNNTQKIRQLLCCDFFYICMQLREAIISVLSERAAPLRRSLNRADAEKSCVHTDLGSTNDHRDSLKFEFLFLSKACAGRPI